MITKYMHKETGSVDDMDGWLSAYSAEELEERGFASAQAAFEHDTAAGMLVKQEFCDDLQELTGQESGIVLYKERDSDRVEAIVCNWSGVDGLPRVSPLGDSIIGLGESIPKVEGHEADWEEIDALMRGAWTVYSHGEQMPNNAMRFDFNIGALEVTVLAPDDWV